MKTGEWLTVAVHVNFSRHVCYVHFKPVLYQIQNLRIFLIRDECYGKALCSKSTSSGNLGQIKKANIKYPPKQGHDALTHSMQVGVWVLRHVVVEDDVNPLNVHSSAKHVSSHQYSLTEILEWLVATKTSGNNKKYQCYKHLHNSSMFYTQGELI